MAVSCGLCSANYGAQNWNYWKRFNFKSNLKSLNVAALLSLSVPCVVAQTVIYSVKDGRWSDPNTWWGSQVPNCDFVVIKTSVVLDQNVGTNCGGSKWIRDWSYPN